MADRRQGKERGFIFHFSSYLIILCLTLSLVIWKLSPSPKGQGPDVHAWNSGTTCYLREKGTVGRAELVASGSVRYQKESVLMQDIDILFLIPLSKTHTHTIETIHAASLAVSSKPASQKTDRNPNGQAH